MNFHKRILSICLTANLLCTFLSTSTFAETNNPVPEIANTDGETISLEKLDTDALENAPTLPDQEFNSLESISDEEKNR